MFSRVPVSTPSILRVASYRVAFDGRWQGKFASEEDAVEWASKVGETGRTVFVVRYRFPRRKLIAVFPPSYEAAARKRWRRRGAEIDGGGAWPAGL